MDLTKILVVIACIILNNVSAAEKDNILIPDLDLSFQWESEKIHSRVRHLEGSCLYFFESKWKKLYDDNMILDLKNSSFEASIKYQIQDPKTEIKETDHTPPYIKINHEFYLYLPTILMQEHWMEIFKKVKKSCSGNEQSTTTLQANFYIENPKVDLLITGKESWVRKIESIRHAKKSIFIQNLSWRGDESGIILAEELIKKRHEGLDVRVIVDPLANNMIPSTTPDFVKENTFRLFNNLLASGIQVMGLNPGCGKYQTIYNEWQWTRPYAIQHRSHEKLFIIDHSLAIVGGRNVANHYFGVDEDESDRRWYDLELILHDDASFFVEKIFLRNYHLFHQNLMLSCQFMDYRGAFNSLSVNSKAYHRFEKEHSQTYAASRKKISENLLVERFKIQYPTVKTYTKNDDLAHFYILEQRPKRYQQEISDYYLNLIHNAQNEIIIVHSYFLPIKEIKEALLNASKRGVKITIITNHENSSDVPLITQLAYGDFKEFLSLDFNDHPHMSSMMIYEWDKNKSKEHGMIHAKMMIIDRKYFVLGSYNLDPRSHQFNSELALAGESHQMIQRLYEQFIIPIMEEAEEITLEKINNRPLSAKISAQLKEIFRDFL